MQGWAAMPRLAVQGLAEHSREQKAPHKREAPTYSRASLAVSSPIKDLRPHGKAKTKLGQGHQGKHVSWHWQTAVTGVAWLNQTFEPSLRQSGSRMRPSKLSTYQSLFHRGAQGTCGSGQSNTDFPCQLLERSTDSNRFAAP